MGKRGGNFFFQGSRHRSLIFFPFWSRSRTPGLSFKFYIYLFGDYIIQDKESMHKNFIQSGLPPYLASHSRTHKHNSGLVLQLQILVHELWSYKSKKERKENEQTIVTKNALTSEHSLESVSDALIAPHNQSYTKILSSGRTGNKLGLTDLLCCAAPASGHCCNVTDTSK